MSFALSYDYTHTKMEKLRQFYFRRVSDEQQSSSVHAEPASGCVINVCLMKTCSEIFSYPPAARRWPRCDCIFIGVFIL